MCVGRRQLNRVGDEGACALAEALLSNSRLQRLGLSANRLSPQVRRRCSSALGRVAWNCMMQTLSASLHSPQTRPHALGTSQFALRSAGWWLLSSLWRHLTTPHLLCQAAAAFAWMLRSNSSLLALDLSCNALGPAGARELLTALPHNRCAAESARTCARHSWPHQLQLVNRFDVVQDLLLQCPCVQTASAACVVTCVCAQGAGRAGGEVLAGR